MSKRYYSDWLRSFVEYASFGEAPLKMLFWTGVSTVAGALRRRVWIDQKYFTWVPNFYVVLVAPPGIVSKSTTANIGMNLLRKVPGINFGPDVVTWQSLVQSLAKSTEAVPNPHNLQEYYPMSAVTISSDEFGTFLNPNDREMIDVLVSLWDGKQGSFRKETKMSGNDVIENPWINIIACTTPAWIAGNFPEYMIGGGFTSRCVFIYAEKKRQLVAYVDEVVPKGFEETRDKLIHDLEIISQLFGQFELDAGARVWGKKWYERHWSSPPANLSSEQFGGYLSRKQTHIHKLAMVLSASDADNLVITSTHLERAEAMVGSIEADMPKVFARIGQNDLTRGAADIVVIVERSPGISQSDLYKHLFRTLSYRDFVEAMAGAINAGHIRTRSDGNTIRYFPVKNEEHHGE